MTNSPTVAIDVDGVLTEHNRLNMERLNERFGTDYKYEEITSFEYSFLTEEERTFIYHECWHDPTLYDGTELNECQLKSLSMLEDAGCNIIVVSSPLLGHIESKYRFLTSYFDRSQIILASDKSLVRCDLLLDDGAHNLDAVREAGTAIPVCFDRPWNRDWSGYRVADWLFVPNTIFYALTHGDTSDD